jgi:opacity protein-like surface antigen
MGKMRCCLLGLGALAVFLGSDSAHAEDEYNRRGAFFGLGASYEVPAFQGILTGRGSDSWGFNAHGGYRFNDFLAAEGVYEYGSFGGSVRSPRTGARAAVDVQTNLAMGGGKLILPLGRLQPYLWGGVGFLNGNGSAEIERGDGQVVAESSTQGAGFAGRVAGGLDFYLTPHVALYSDASYVMPATGPTDLYYFSLGFGGRYVF